MLALNYYHQALMADTGAKDRRGRALRQERLGRTFLDLKDYDRAAVYLKEALSEFRRLQDTDGIAAALKDLTLLALARGDQEEARLNGKLLLGIYQARGQEQEARELEALLQRAAGADAPASAGCFRRHPVTPGGSFSPVPSWLGTQLWPKLCRGKHGIQKLFRLWSL